MVLFSRTRHCVVATAIRPAGRGPCGWLLDGVELDPVQQGAVVDGPGVGGSPAEGLEVCFPGAADIVLVDRGEGNQLDRVDLDPAQSDRVTAPRRHFRPTPEPERDSDLARQDVLTQLFAELHLPDSMSQLCGVRPLQLRLVVQALTVAVKDCVSRYAAVCRPLVHQNQRRGRIHIGHASRAGGAWFAGRARPAVGSARHPGIPGPVPGARGHHRGTAARPRPNSARAEVALPTTQSRRSALRVRGGRGLGSVSFGGAGAAVRFAWCCSRVPGQGSGRGVSMPLLAAIICGPAAVTDVMPVSAIETSSSLRMISMALATPCSPPAPRP